MTGIQPTPSAVLAKLKVGGLVLVVTVLAAGTAEAATGGSLFSDEAVPVTSSADLVGGDCATEEPVPDPSTDPSNEPTADPSGEPTAEPEPTDDASEPADPTDCESPSEDPTDEPTDGATDEPTDGATENPSDEPTGEPTDSETDEPTDNPSDGPVACADARNHGEYVSSVAHSVPPGPGHGAAVSAAAHSDCGKKKADESGEDEKQGAGDESSDASGNGHASHKGGKPEGWVPPGQAKKDESAGGKSHGNSGHTGGAPGNSGNAPGHNKNK